MSDEMIDARMTDDQGRVFLPANRGEAAWLAVECGARPVDPDLFPWPGVLALAGPRRIDPAVYLPGSAL